MNRRQRRADARKTPRVDRGVHVGPRIVEDVPGKYDQGAQGRLAAKIPGKHRWMILAAYAVSEDSVWAEVNGDGGATYLDHETRFSLSLGCWDCEQQFPDIDPSTSCPAEAMES